MSIEDILASLHSCDSEDELTALYFNSKKLFASICRENDNPASIQRNRENIMILYECLSLFVHLVNPISRKSSKIFPDIFSLCVPSIIRFQNVLDDPAVNEYFISICVTFARYMKDDKNELFDKISHSLRNILDFILSQETLLPNLNLVPNIFLILFFLCSNGIKETKFAIFSLISPYLRRISTNLDFYSFYQPSSPHCEFKRNFPHLMFDILNNLMWLDETKSINPEICDEMWMIFRPNLSKILASLTNKDEIKSCTEAIRFACLLAKSRSTSEQCLEVYRNVSAYIDSCKSVFTKAPAYSMTVMRLVLYWQDLIIFFSSVPCVRPFISPRYDDTLLFASRNSFSVSKASMSLYIINTLKYLSKHKPLQTYIRYSLLRSVSPIHLIPTLHICTSTLPSLFNDEKPSSATDSGVGSKIKHDDPMTTDSHSSSQSRFNFHFYVHTVTCIEPTVNDLVPHHPIHHVTKRLLINSMSCPSELIFSEVVSQKDIPSPFHSDSGASVDAHSTCIKYSSLFQYTVPRHMLVTIPLGNERVMRQSVYDFIERTGAAVEILFDDNIIII
ncbi:hypothetical protein ADUPG1_012033 [Aduncisulcus paluster]|uniref:Uncharacterized protein n=1 Tax=Aduncisulcus paluster TaxID=2918883 RepID=A0ABQ5K1U7_9EUKA|nr:hypothetical protein ADUPG1_012033 [Aduncisulcus paluster]